MTLEKEFVKPGKSQALNRVKIRKLLSGKVLAPKFHEHSSTEQKILSNSIHICNSQHVFFNTICNHWTNNDMEKQCSREANRRVIKMLGSVVIVSATLSHIAHIHSVP